MATESARVRDVNGFVKVAKNPISKVGVFPYAGSEIGAAEPNKIYMVYRSAEELGRAETIESFNLLPFIDDHEFLGEGGTPAEKKGVQGTTGEAAEFDHPYLRNTLRVFSTHLAGLIDAGKIELSPSYRCEYDFTPGVFEGQSYDAVQRKILGNHLALVDRGRTGPDVAVLDHYRVTSDSLESKMEFTEEQMEQIGKLIAAMVAAEVAKTSASSEETPDESGVAATDPATDEPGTDKEEEVVDAATPQATKPADPAADAASIIRQINARDTLANRLVPHIGSFNHGAMIDETDVAKYAANKLGIVASDSELVATVKGFLHAAKAPVETIVSDRARVDTNVGAKFWKE